MADFTIAPLLDAWDRASVDLRTRIGERAQQAADQASDRIRQTYPDRTGRLRGSVRVTPPRGWTVSQGALLPAHVVRATAPHVHFVEDGTAERVDSTRRNARRGRMPQIGPIFRPIALDERVAYVADAERILNEPREVI